jgi:sec-independent protein translocase protein TatA
MFDVGGGELLLILLVVILLFGPKKIPEVAQQVGKGIRQFRRAQEDLKQQIRDISAEISVEETLHATTPPPPSYTPADQIVATPPPTLESPQPDIADEDEHPPKDASLPQ